MNLAWVRNKLAFLFFQFYWDIVDIENNVLLYHWNLDKTSINYYDQYKREIRKTSKNTPIDLPVASKLRSRRGSYCYFIPTGKRSTITVIPRSWDNVPRFSVIVWPRLSGHWDPSGMWLPLPHMVTTISFFLTGTLPGKPWAILPREVQLTPRLPVNFSNEKLF